MAAISLLLEIFSRTCCRSGDLRSKWIESAHFAKRDSTSAGMPHESRDRIRQRDLICRQPRGITIGKGGRRIVLGVETISRNTMQEVYGLASAWERTGGIYPEGSKITLTIERLDGGSVLRAHYVLLKSIRN